MYIKMIFKRDDVDVPRQGHTHMDTLFKMPTIVDDVPMNEEIDVYVPVHSQFHSSNPSMFYYYIDCYDMTREQVKKALDYFSGHYNIQQNGLPSMLMSGHPGRSELIVNMRVSLHNAKHEDADWKPYASKGGIGNAHDVVCMFCP
ncbi:MAG TPA: hypothetical protein VL360_02920 [Gammaproteobacteria bacterium]|jgi:hypothetical protein|nr:hypothetical protein [Gammaproteobacteria bacterium]